MSLRRYIPRARLICLIAALLWLSGCTHAPVAAPPVHPAVQAAGFPRTVEIAPNDRLTLPAPPRRIISLTPSTTEILYRLGLQDRLVMDTTACDYPPAAQQKPHIDAIGGSIEPVLAQSPDLIIAVGGLNDRLIAALKPTHAPVLEVQDSTLSQTYDAIRLIGKATGADTQAEQVVSDMQTRIDAVRAAARRDHARPSVMMMYSVNPIYTTGPNSYINDVIDSAGGRNVIDRPLAHDVISPEAVIALGPSVIICSPQTASLAQRVPGWAEGVSAVRDRRFYYAEDALVRPGPRLADATERLARFLHPGILFGPTITPKSGAARPPSSSRDPIRTDQYTEIRLKSAGAPGSR